MVRGRVLSFPTASVLGMNIGLTKQNHAHIFLLQNTMATMSFPYYLCQESQQQQSQRYHSKQPGEPQLFDSIVRVVITSDLGKPECDSDANIEI